MAKFFHTKSDAEAKSLSVYILLLTVFFMPYGKIIPVSITALLVSLIGFSSAPAFAQETEIDPTANITGLETGPELNSTSTELPILEKISDKGIYNVQLKWVQSQVNPEDGIDIELVFLNASAPEATAETIPQLESNLSGFSQNESAGFNVPGAIQSPLAVESYDLAVYTDDGTELWKKAGLFASGGMDGERIVYEGSYTGPVTIEVTNIIPGWAVPDETSTAGEDLVDSVTFTATVVPEFPLLAALPLVAGIAGVLSFMRLRAGRHQ